MNIEEKIDLIRRHGRIAGKSDEEIETAVSVLRFIAMTDQFVHRAKIIAMMAIRSKHHAECKTCQARPVGPKTAAQFAVVAKLEELVRSGMTLFAAMGGEEVTALLNAYEEAAEDPPSDHGGLH